MDVDVDDVVPACFEPEWRKFDSIRIRSDILPSGMELAVSAFWRI